MAFQDLTNRRAVLDAVEEYDRLGRDEFLAKYGFRPALNYFLVVNGREYDSKAIVGVAHGYQFPEQGPLRSSEFSGGLATVMRKLNDLGFEVRVLDGSKQDHDYWWDGLPAERYWVEIRRVREGFGRELRCPFLDRDGNVNGWYDLVDDLRPGDCVYHWNADEARFLGRSVVDSPRTVDEETGERIVELGDFLPLSVDIGLDQLRGMVGELTAIRDSLRARYGSQHRLYHPFQLRSDGVRLMSNYFAHLPAEMQQVVFGPDGFGEDDLPVQADDYESPAAPAAKQDGGRPGGFLFPFKERADTDYVANVAGGPFRRTRTHETLVNDFAAWLAQRGLAVSSNAAIDLGLEDPPIIIEAKVIRGGQWAWAIREAIGQLYEYRYFQVVAPESQLLFLASEEIPRRWFEYLDTDRQIGAAWRSAEGFRLSGRAIRMVGGSGLRRTARRTT